jgi:hypothetical protein
MPAPQHEKTARKIGFIGDENQRAIEFGARIQIAPRAPDAKHGQRALRMVGQRLHQATGFPFGTVELSFLDKGFGEHQRGGDDVAGAGEI